MLVKSVPCNAALLWQISSVHWSEYDQVIQISSSISELLSRGRYTEQDSRNFLKLLIQTREFDDIVTKLDQNVRVYRYIMATGAFKNGSIVRVKKKICKHWIWA